MENRSAERRADIKGIRGEGRLREKMVCAIGTNENLVKKITRTTAALPDDDDNDDGDDGVDETEAFRLGSKTVRWK